MDEVRLRIGEVARRSGLTIRTLRHYDELGILVPSERTEGDYRLYSPADLRRLLEIQQLKSLGLGLAEIARALNDADHDAAAVIDEHIAAVEHRIQSDGRLLVRLRELRDAAEFGWDDVLSLIGLIRRLEHPEPTVRMRATLDATADVPLSALLARFMAESNPGNLELLGWALAQHGPAATPVLVEALNAAGPAQRRQLVRVLGKIGDDHAVPALLALLDDDPEIASMAVSALGDIGGGPALRALVSRLGQGELKFREDLTTSLAGFGSAAVADLAAALSRPEAHVREHAADVLGDLGEPAAAEALARALGDAVPAVREAALLALGRTSGERAFEAVRAMTTSGDPRQRGIAQRLLERLQSGR